MFTRNILISHIFHSRSCYVRSELEIVNKEIDELKKRLAEKEAEAAKLSVVIAHHDAAIVEVRNEFIRQVDRVSKKDLELKEQRNGWDADTKDLELMTELHKREVEAYSEELRKRVQLMNRIKDEVNIAEKVETIIANELAVGKGLSPDLLEQHAAVVKCRVDAVQANEELRVALAWVECLREELIQIDKTIPLLEEERRFAVSNRAFKAAAKACKEIMDAVTR